MPTNDVLTRNTVYNTLGAPYITKRDVEEAPTVDGWVSVKDIQNRRRRITMQDNDLISRDAAKEIVSLMVCAPTIKIAAEHEIDDLPGFDAAPVVHGRWEFCGDDDIICNVCRARYLKERLLQSYYTGIGSDKMDGFWHCPHCGALLDGGENQ